MSIEDNKAIARRFIEEVFVARDRAAVDELAAADFTPHSWATVEPGRESLKAAVDRVAAGLSEVTMTIDDMIAEGDRVAVRLTSSAVQSGTFMGLPPSGAHYSVPEIHVFRIRDGQVVEHWREMDSMSLMRQLGVVPAPG